MLLTLLLLAAAVAAFVLVPRLISPPFKSVYTPPPRVDLVDEVVPPTETTEETK